MEGESTQLSMFKQQAAIIAKKKENAAERLNELRGQLQEAERERDEKMEQVKANAGNSEILRGEEFKRYVNSMRNKNTTYKKHKQILSELKAEVGILSRTQDILKSRDEQINEHLNALEESKGVSGFRNTQEELERVSSIKSELDERKGKTLEDMSSMVQKLHQKIDSKKNELQPIIKEIRPLRQRCQELTQEHEQKKASYDSTLAGLESNMAKVQQEVSMLMAQYQQDQARYHLLQSQLQMGCSEKERLTNEQQGRESGGEKKASLREQYMRKIQEAEARSKTQREQQRSLRENHAQNLKQVKMWSDVQRIMDAKMRLKQLGAAVNEPPPTSQQQDHLII